MMMSTRGSRMSPAALAKLRMSFRLKPYWLMSLATASAVAHLANSAGCTLQKPRLTHEREPLMSLATKGVTSSTTIMPQ